MIQAICDNPACKKTVTITHEAHRAGLNYPVEWMGYVHQQGSPEEHFCVLDCLTAVHPEVKQRRPSQWG